MATLLQTVRRRLSRPDTPVTDESVMAAVQNTKPVPLSHAALLRLAGQIGDELTGAGPLQALLDDEQVSDVLVNGPHQIWVDDGSGLRLTNVSFADETAVRSLATRLANACGRRLDDAHPCVDARLPDGTRLHAILPPIAPNGPYLSLRAHRRVAFDLPALQEAGTVNIQSAQLLSQVIAARAPFLITGGTGSGKTTLLSTLLSEVAVSERIVMVEDAAELRPRHPHVLGLQARQANVEGVGELKMSTLVRQALRMRPDRIVIGECRGAEVIELLTALNTGHDGGAGTLHANAAADVPTRLAALAMPHGLTRPALHALMASALRVIAHMRRTPNGRVVSEISLLEVSEDHASVRVSPAWRLDAGECPGRHNLQRLLQKRTTRDVAL